MMGKARERRYRTGYANVVATLAIFLAIGGGGFAIAALSKNSVGSKQIKAGSVNTEEIANEAVSAKKLRDGAVSGTTLTKSSAASISLTTTPSPVISLELPNGAFALLAMVDVNNASGGERLVTCSLDAISGSKNKHGDFFGDGIQGVDRLTLSGAAEMKRATQEVAGIARGAAVVCAAETAASASASAVITAIPTGAVDEIEN